MISIVLAAAAAAAPALTPEKVGAMIDGQGAARTVATLSAGDLSKHNLYFDNVLDGISSGNAKWLALVPRLRPGTDGASGEFLRIAIARALPHNAAGVLRLSAHGWPVADACSYPMIEPRPADTGRYFATAIPAVQAVRDPGLQAAKAICLSELQKAQKTVKHSVGPHPTVPTSTLYSNTSTRS